MHLLDFSKVTVNYIILVTEILGQFECFKNFYNFLLIHNVGSIGQVTDVHSFITVDVWQDYYEFNFFSVVFLNKLFVGALIRGTVPNIFVVNISSLMGRQAFCNMGMYGSGKAARDMFFKTLALEEPKVKVLNYSPFPLILILMIS